MSKTAQMSGHGHETCDLGIHNSVTNQRVTAPCQQRTRGGHSEDERGLKNHFSASAPVPDTRAVKLQIILACFGCRSVKVPRWGLQG